MALLCICILSQISENDSSLFTLDSVYYLYEPVSSDTMRRDSIFKPFVRDTTPQDLGTFKMSGSKDFSFDVQQGFDQGLNVNMTGEVQGVGIEGTISDKSTPSSTLRLSEVENVRLKVFTDYVYGGIGNLTLDLPFGIRDELQGGTFGIHNKEKETRIAASYAVRRGTAKRMRFSGQEGKQSPYFLEGSALPGSERVYLAQGIAQPLLLQRDLDYDIDYERGILSFTNTHIITNRSRIEVEYQQAVEDFTNIYTESDGRAELGAVAFQAMYRRKYDDKEDPLTFTLSPAEIESLAVAGDSMVVRHTFADTSSQGSYILQDNHFVYVGEGNGAYNVTFFYVGEGSGDYVYDAQIKAFVFQGTGLGNYTPTKFTPLPEKDEFYGIGIDIAETFGVNVYGSNFDKNTFSPRDDEDDFGSGYTAHLTRKMKGLTIDAQYIRYEETFYMPQGKEMFDYQYQWNTSESLKKLGTATLGMQPMPWLQCDVGYGVLNNEHRRKSIVIKPAIFEFGYEGIDTLNKYFTGLSKKTGALTFASRYEYVQKSHMLDYEIAYARTPRTAISLSGNYDRDTTNRGITTRLDITTSPLALALGHRRFNDTTFLFGNARLNIRYRGFSVVGNLQQNQRYSQKRDEIYVKVDEGEGTYVYDSITGTYRESEGGDYIKQVFLLQEFERVVSKNYNIEAGYAHALYDVGGRFYYLNEKDFKNIINDIALSLHGQAYTIELNARQDELNDARFALTPQSRRERLLSCIPTYNVLSARFDVRELIDKQNELVRERKTAYGGEIAYRIISNPVVRPTVGYTFSKLFSDYFENLDINIQAPKIGILCGIPLAKNGRLELTGELIYRKYTIETVPLFFSATEPPGLTRSVGASAGLGLGKNTNFSLLYRLEFPPDDDIRQNLRFGSKIRF